MQLEIQNTKSVIWQNNPANLIMIAFLLSLQFNAIVDYDDDLDFISSDPFDKLETKYTSSLIPLRGDGSIKWKWKHSTFLQVFRATSLELRNRELQRRWLSTCLLLRDCNFPTLQIAALVSSEFGVEFRMMEKVDVKGSNVHPVWRYLTGKALGG